MTKPKRGSVPSSHPTPKPAFKKRRHPKFGTSKLEKDFAKDILDKLGLRYEWQYEAKSIGRFFDYAVYTPSGSMVLIEVDGGYYHSDPRVVDENKLNPMQKHNKRVDEDKNLWAALRGIPLIRIWEKDIREKPLEILRNLKSRLFVADEKNVLKQEKNKRHRNRLNENTKKE